MDGIITTFEDKKIKGYLKIDNASVYDDTIVVENGFEQFYSVCYMDDSHEFFMNDDEAYEVKGNSTGKSAYLKLCPFYVKIVFGPKIKNKKDAKPGNIYVSKEGNILLEATNNIPNYYLKYKNDWVYAGKYHIGETEWHLSTFDMKCVLLCLRALKIKLPKVLCFLIMDY